MHHFPSVWNHPVLLVETVVKWMNRSTSTVSLLFSHHVSLYTSLCSLFYIIWYLSPPDCKDCSQSLDRVQNVKWSTNVLVWKLKYFFLVLVTSDSFTFECNLINTISLSLFHVCPAACDRPHRSVSQLDYDSVECMSNNKMRLWDVSWFWSVIISACVHFYLQ